MRTKVHSTGVGPEFTPLIIKYLILITSIASVSIVLSEGLIHHLFGTSGLAEFFALSWGGMSSLYLWQPFTYFFLYGAAEGTTITFFWLLGLAFNMYILWIMGSNIAERVTALSFSKMYLLSGVIAGFSALMMMLITGHYSLVYGPAPCIFATLLVWSMLNPDSDLLLFFVLPIKSRWLVAGLLIVIFLVNLSSGQFVDLALYTAGALTGYLYGLWIWNLKSPFVRLQVIDEWLLNLKSKTISSLPWTAKCNGKVYDFQTGKLINKDDRFMDAMLDKISKQGKESLTWFERMKMNRIAKRKNKRGTPK